MDHFEYVKCNICGTNNTKPLYSVKECTGRYKETFKLVYCEKCGLVYLNPRPDRSEINKYYPSDTYYAYQESSLDRKCFKNKIKSYLLEIIGGYKKPLFGFIIKLIFNNIMLGTIPYKKGGFLLDIGCGNGNFLKWHKDHGWNVFGIEINKDAADICRRNSLDVFNGDISDALIPYNTFDVVTLIQALEHLYNPSATLKKVYDILKKDGLLLIGVPNFGCFDRKIYKDKWLALEIPRHLYHFEIPTLNKLLEINGFKIKKIKGKGYFWYGIKNISHIKENNIRDKVKILISLFIIKPLLFLLSKKRKEKFAVFISLYCEK